MNIAEVVHISEHEIERDRKTCISLFHRVTGANRELAQWLLDHPRYSNRLVAEWLDCSFGRIGGLRSWANKGFPGESHRSGDFNRSGGRGRTQTPLISQQNFQDGLETEEDDGSRDYVAQPEVIRKNILDSIERHTAVVRSYKKIIRVSSLDQAMKEEVRHALGVLITTCQTLQRALCPGRIK